MTRTRDVANVSTTFPIGAWTAYTPTLTGLTVGTGGTVVGRYSKFGKTVSGYVRVTLGTGFTITDLAFSLPLAKQATTTYVQASWTLTDVGSGDFTAIPRFETGNVVAAYIMRASNPWVDPQTVTSTTPFTWASGDFINAAFTYECA